MRWQGQIAHTNLHEVKFSIPKRWWGRQGVNIIWHLQNITYKWRVIWNISMTVNSFNCSLALFTHQTRRPFLCAWLRRARQSHLVEKRGKCAFCGKQEAYSRKYFHYLLDFFSFRETLATEVISLLGSTKELNAMCRTMPPSGYGKWVPSNLPRTSEEPLITENPSPQWKLQWK